MFQYSETAGYMAYFVGVQSQGGEYEEKNSMVDFGLSDSIGNDIYFM
jgi:hypothetical protein